MHSLHGAPKLAAQPWQARPPRSRAGRGTPQWVLRHTVLAHQCSHTGPGAIPSSYYAPFVPAVQGISCCRRGGTAARAPPVSQTPRSQTWAGVAAVAAAAMKKRGRGGAATLVAEALLAPVRLRQETVCGDCADAAAAARAAAAAAAHVRGPLGGAAAIIAPPAEAGMGRQRQRRLCPAPAVRTNRRQPLHEKNGHPARPRSRQRTGLTPAQIQLQQRPSLAGSGGLPSWRPCGGSSCSTGRPGRKRCQRRGGCSGCESWVDRRSTWGRAQHGVFLFLFLHSFPIHSRLIVFEHQNEALALSRRACRA